MPANMKAVQVALFPIQRDLDPGFRPLDQFLPPSRKTRYFLRPEDEVLRGLAGRLRDLTSIVGVVGRLGVSPRKRTVD
jgi:hypothetical protein